MSISKIDWDKSVDYGFYIYSIVEKQNRGDINLKQISLRNIPGRL